MKSENRKKRIVRESLSKKRVIFTGFFGKPVKKPHLSHPNQPREETMRLLRKAAATGAFVPARD